MNHLVVLFGLQVHEDSNFSNQVDATGLKVVSLERGGLVIKIMLNGRYILDSDWQNSRARETVYLKVLRYRTEQMQITVYRRQWNHLPTGFGRQRKIHDPWLGLSRRVYDGCRKEIQKG